MGLIELGPWNEEPVVWSTMEIDQKQVPGTCRVLGVKRSNKWDRKKAEGEHGGKGDFKGSDLASGKFEIKLLTSTEAVAFADEWLPVLEPIEKAKQVAHRVSHPVCSWRRISSFTVDNISGPDETSEGSGIWIVSIDWTEAREPTAKNGTGKGVAGKLTNKCAQLLADYGVAQANYALYQATYQNAVNNLKSFEGGFGNQSSDAATYYAKAQAELAKMGFIAAEQLARGCNDATPSSKPANTDP